MRKLVFFASCALFVSLPLRAATATSDRLSRYFAGWYPLCPGTRISVTASPEIEIAGYEAYKIERQCDVKNRNELSIALVESARDEVFIGEVLYSAERHDRPFAAVSDLPEIQGALQETFGLPVIVRTEGASRGALIPLRVSIRQADKAAASISGFVSQDGAALLIGEFHPLSVAPEQWRETVLSESPGIRAGKGKSAVTAFIDFQCEKCRLREPQVRTFAAAHDVAVEVRFLPLVKVHNWAFAAAESASALAGVSPDLYSRYEGAIFPRAGTMTEAAARELAADIADAASVRPAFDAEIASGRARERVVRDVDLALRLGLNGTPVFFYRGTWIPSDAGLAESYVQSRLSGNVQSRLSGTGKPPASGPPR